MYARFRSQGQRTYTLYLLIFTTIIFFGSVILYSIRVEQFSLPLFITTLRSVDTIFLRDIGGLTLRGLQNGERRRLLTAGFLHANILHLLSNMLGLFFLGTVIERSFGKLQMLSIYLLSIVGGSLLSVAMQIMGSGDTLLPMIVSVGASGGVFGLVGAVAIAGRYRAQTGVVVSPFFYSFIMLNFILSFGPGIDFRGHVGGFVVGVVMAIIILQDE